MASFYERKILPRLIHHVCGLSPMSKQREKIIPQASGRVLELGIGSGHNLRYYDATQVDHIIGVDPTPDHSKLDQAMQASKVSAEFLEASAEDLPIDSNSIDNVVCTYVLCTIPDARQALEECKRVLKPGGRFLFVEHGIAPNAKVRKTQERVNPYWKKIAGGCHLNRDIPAILAEVGFTTPDLATMYLPGWKPATYNFLGAATAR